VDFKQGGIGFIKNLAFLESRFQARGRGRFDLDIKTQKRRKNRYYKIRNNPREGKVREKNTGKKEIDPEITPREEKPAASPLTTGFAKVGEKVKEGRPSKKSS